MEVVLKKIRFQGDSIVEMTHPQGLLIPCAIIKQALLQSGFDAEIEIKDGE